MSSEVGVDVHDLLRVSWSRRGGGVVCYIKSWIAYSNKDSFCLEFFFSNIYLPKFKSILLDILYSLPDESNFFTETGVLDKQECYLLKCETYIWIHSLTRKNIFDQNLPPQTQGYLDFCFSFSLEQLISMSSWLTSKAVTLIDHVVINFFQIMNELKTIKLSKNFCIDTH